MESYLDYRRKIRNQIELPQNAIWERSPPPKTDHEEKNNGVSSSSLSTSKSSSNSSNKPVISKKKDKNDNSDNSNHESPSSSGSESSASVSSSEDDHNKKSKHKKSHKGKHKHKSHKKEKKRSRHRHHHSESSSPSSSESESEGASESDSVSGDDALEIWTEKTPPTLALPKLADTPVGPMPLPKVEAGSYGGALLPGEGSAMAAYVQENKRIPRRGEIGLTSEEIEKFENAGFVMSGSRYCTFKKIRD